LRQFAAQVSAGRLPCGEIRVTCSERDYPSNRMERHGRLTSSVRYQHREEGGKRRGRAGTGASTRPHAASGWVWRPRQVEGQEADTPQVPEVTGQRLRLDWIAAEGAMADARSAGNRVDN
jgi:hypothetical protein